MGVGRWGRQVVGRVNTGNQTETGGKVSREWVMMWMWEWDVAAYMLPQLLRVETSKSAMRL
jgi:hypothetical protein